MYVDKEGWLQPARPFDPGVIRVPTARTSPLQGKEPLGVVNHTTDDPPTDDYPWILSKRWENLPPEGTKSASIHLFVALRGVIYQIAPFTVGTWHTLRGGEIGGKVVDRINRNSIGVEWVNGGRLKYVTLADGTHEWRCHDYLTKGRAINDPKLAVKATAPRPLEFEGKNIPKGGVWCNFTPAQEETCFYLYKALRERYGFSWKDLTRTHSEYNPERREDPGPIFMDEVLPRVKAKLYANEAVS